MCVATAAQAFTFGGFGGGTSSGSGSQNTIAGSERGCEWITCICGQGLAPVLVPAQGPLQAALSVLVVTHCNAFTFGGFGSGTSSGSGSQNTIAGSAAIGLSAAASASQASATGTGTGSGSGTATGGAIAHNLNNNTASLGIASGTGGGGGGGTANASTSRGSFSGSAIGGALNREQLRAPQT